MIDGYYMWSEADAKASVDFQGLGTASATGEIDVDALVIGFGVKRYF